MARELCLIHANCQGDALKELLEASPAFAARYEIRHLRNYTREHLDQGLLDSASLFLHQYLTEKWGEISTSQVLARLRPQARTLCIPNCMFTGYWPFWQSRPDIIEFSDWLLEALLAKGLSHGEILHLYMKADPALTGDIEKNALDSLAREKEKEAHTPIKYAHIIESGWRERQLFLTINHPAPMLLVHIASEILAQLELGKIPESFARNYVSPHAEFWLPIHPEAGARLGLPFVSRDRLYPCFGCNLTHYEYIVHYLACRAHNFKDLPGELASHSRTIQSRCRARMAH